MKSAVLHLKSFVKLAKSDHTKFVAAASVMLSFIGACENNKKSELASFSIKAEQNFSVEKSSTNSGVDTNAVDYLITFKGEGELRGLRITTANPNTVSNVSVAVAEDTCANLNYAGLAVWRLPIQSELELLRTSYLALVGNGSQPLFASVQKLVGSDMFSSTTEFDLNSCREFGGALYKNIVSLRAIVFGHPLLARGTDSILSLRSSKCYYEKEATSDEVNLEIAKQSIQTASFICVKNP